MADDGDGYRCGRVVLVGAETAAGLDADVENVEVVAGDERSVRTGLDSAGHDADGLVALRERALDRAAVVVQEASGGEREAPVAAAAFGLKAYAFTTRSGSGTFQGRVQIALIAVNTPTFSAMPTTSASSAIAVNAGCVTSECTA